MDQRKYKKSNSDKSPRGRLLIQHYIYDLQTRSGGESRLLPSSRELAAQFGVMSIPTLLVFENGKVVKQSIGYIEKDEVMALIQ